MDKQKGKGFGTFKKGNQPTNAKKSSQTPKSQPSNSQSQKSQTSSQKQNYNDNDDIDIMDTMDVDEEYEGDEQMDMEDNGKRK